MNSQILIDTTAAIFADGKGLLAMDESNPTGQSGTCDKAMNDLVARNDIGWAYAI